MQTLADTPGLHHVTGIVGDAQDAVDFYVGVLGLRPIALTVNFEDILQHHLYFGDANGTPGTVITCFPDPHGDPGRVGPPQPESVAFLVPDGSLAYWRNRLDGFDVKFEYHERFDERVLRFEDPAGTRLELVAESTDAAGPNDEDVLEPQSADSGPVPESATIRGLHGVATLSVNPYATASMLETLGFEHEAEDGDRVRYRASGSRATVIDVLDCEASFGREGVGTLHHVAVRAESEDALFEWRELFDERGYDVSRVKDRHVFHSLYVREPGGILFELATDPTRSIAATAMADVDWTSDRELPLYLPDWFEDDRDLIESQLPALELPSTATENADGEP
ncbi:VOC family protein [Natrialbaceae archaeon A-arb3/5]